MAVDQTGAVRPWEEDRPWRAACLANWGMPKLIDLRRFASESQRVDGAFAIRRLVRLIEGLPEQPLVREVSAAVAQEPGVVWFSLLGQMQLGRKPQVVLKVQAQIRLTCQRCMQPLTYTVDESVLFDVVRQESALKDANDAEPLDLDTPEELVADTRFDIGQLIEDQLILAVPYVPKHSNCSAAVSPAEEEPVATRVSPFGSLAALKGR
jgi:uncharacterized protein|uniref:YceD family protein n=1 Tax=Orrella sp. TaxID=1921583 RepID=UPI00404786A1